MKGTIAIIALAAVMAAAGLMLSGAFVFAEPSGPVIMYAQASPEKVYPGQDLEIIVAFSDAFGVEEAVAYFPYEGGSDQVAMSLAAGDIREGTYTAKWKAHDTMAYKWYSTPVTLANRLGESITVNVAWQDPTVSHTPGQINLGTSADAGSTGYNFVTSSTTSGAYAINATSFSTHSVKTRYAVYGEVDSSTGYAAYLNGSNNDGVYVQWDLNVTGTFKDGCVVRGQSSSTVSCPAGKCAIGGGCNANDLYESYPTSISGGCAGGWRCGAGTVYNTYVICC
jgi:hypothetical protein